MCGLTNVEDFWAITAYFNPAGYERRLANYRVFRKNLDVPLVAVELAYGPEFELGKGDAEVLVQLRSTDVLWQKERLLNVALGALPQSCRKVLWTDCDIVFGSKDWVQCASRRLDETALVQPFSRVRYLTKNTAPGEFRKSDVKAERPSVASSVSSGIPVSRWLTDAKFRARPPGLGLAWSARRELLDQHGFYDSCIVGGGDRAIICAAAGSFNELMDSQRMNPGQRRRYLNWATAFHVATGTVDSYVEGNLYHLWHGEFSDRAYVDRHAGLQEFDFDPFVDIAIAGNGAWRWSTEKPDLHAYVRSYFMSRNEDG